jgi:hypothetical protein
LCSCSLLCPCGCSCSCCIRAATAACNRRGFVRTLAGAVEGELLLAEPVADTCTEAQGRQGTKDSWS